MSARADPRTSPSAIVIPQSFDEAQYSLRPDPRQRIIGPQGWA
jgi:hypothetical protein